jgi:hypothetical protein
VVALPTPGVPVLSSAIQQLLRSSLRPGDLHELSELADASARVWLRVAGITIPASIGGCGKRLVHVRIEAAPLPTTTRAMLGVELDEGALRIDVPVEVVSSGRGSSVLRILGAPLVLRRRMVRDRALAEALGVPARALPLVA